MKKESFLPLLVFSLLLPPVFANETTLKSPDQENLPHAFNAGWKGQKTCEVLFEDQTTRVGRCVFPPGIGHEKHYHNPHFGYVLKGGTVLIRDDQGERIVTTNENVGWSTTDITVHEAVNIGDATTSYLIIEPKNP